MCGAGSGGACMNVHECVSECVCDCVRFLLLLNSYSAVLKVGFYITK